jgi:predicted component of type VI protein secretion system
MTREQAQRSWSQIEREIEDALIAKRPRLKSFEVHHSFAVGRRAVLAVYETAGSHEALREVAFNACGIQRLP